VPSVHGYYKISSIDVGNKDDSAIGGKLLHIGAVCSSWVSKVSSSPTLVSPI